MSDSESDTETDSRVVTENEALNRVVTRSRSRQLRAEEVIEEESENESEDEEEEEEDDPPEPPAVTTRKRKLSNPSASAGDRKRARGERSSASTPSSADDTVFEEAQSLVPLEVSDKVAKIITEGLEPSKSKALRDKYCPNFENSEFSLNVPTLDEDFYVRFKVPGVKNAEKEEKRLQSFQFKILDVAKPIFELRGLLSPVSNPRHMELVDAALDLWGVAFNTLTHARRKNIMKVTNPTLLIMLNNRKHFNPKDTSQLFGDKFAKAVVNQSKRIASCNEAEKVLQAQGRQKKAQPQQRSAQPKSYDNPGPSNQQGYSFQQRYVARPFVSDGVIGGRLKFFFAAWQEISNDPWVLQSISEGVKIDWVSTPLLNQPVETRKLPSERLDHVCDNEVRDLLEKGAVVEVDVNSPGFVSPIFAITKQSGGFRPIFNLKCLNQWITYEHFKMEGVKTIKELVEQDDWMVRLDLKDAYLTVPINLQDQKFLQFVWRGRKFQFVSLPFGLSSAPRIFTKLLRPVVAYLRSQGIRLIIYLDDLLLLNRSKIKLHADLDLTVSLLQGLGFVINWEKSEIVPTRSLIYLGLQINSSLLEFCLPREKRLKLIDSCRTILADAHPKLRQVASILGSLNWAVATVPFAQAHYRNLQRLYISHVKATRGNLQVPTVLSSEARTELQWWIEHLNSDSGNSFGFKSPDLIIFCDASLSGWGASCDRAQARGPWTTFEANWHINELELKASLLALQSFTINASNQSVLLMLDNSTAVAYINKRGGTRSTRMNSIMIDIVEWCEKRSLSLSASHIPGVSNTIADELSRSKADSSDWKLDVQTFNQIHSIWPTNLDLFASGWNKQLPKFVSWKPQPAAWGLNAFSIDWNSHRAYLFPPFSLVGRCLKKIRDEKADVVLVAPVWQSQS